MSTSFYTSPVLSTLSASNASTGPSKMNLKSESKRCGHAECKKKLGLLGFDCKCGEKFCGSHRYPSDHSCTFDFKAAAAATLQTQLASCVAEKINKI
jgi:predicted nucleic acid binding AN1-type Zn finger protein